MKQTVRDHKTGRFRRVVREDTTPESADHLADLNPEAQPVHDEEEAELRQLYFDRDKEDKDKEDAILGCVAAFLLAIVAMVIFAIFDVIKYFFM